MTIELINTTDVQGDETNVNWFADGEHANSVVLNRPIKDVSVVVNEVISKLNENIDFNDSGMQILVSGYNGSGSLLNKATPVMIADTTGSSGEYNIDLMDGTVLDNSQNFLGLVTDDISIANSGKVSVFGLIDEIDTTGTLAFGAETWADNDLIWIDNVNAGYLTNVKPSTGMAIKVGRVIFSDASGSLFVNTTKLDENRYIKASEDSTVTGDITLQGANLKMYGTDNVFSPPKLTTAEIDALTGSEAGDIVFNEETEQFLGYAFGNFGTLGGTGDVADEDLYYLNLLNASSFGLIYYDNLLSEDSLDLHDGATWDYPTTSYIGDTPDVIGNVIVPDEEATDYTVNTIYTEGDLIYENEIGWVWECIKSGSAHPYYEPEWNLLGVQSENLDYFWSFESTFRSGLTSGNVISDEMNSSRELTITGGDLTIDETGPSGDGLVFDGSAYLINSSEVAPEMSNDPILVSFWFKVDSLADSGLFEIGDGSSDGEFSISLTGTHLSFDMGGVNLGTYGFTDIQSWHHIIAYNDVTSGRAKLYLDGTEVIDNLAQSAPTLTGLNVYVANYWDGSALAPFTGIIDELKIYSRILNAEEIYYLSQNSGETVYMGYKISDKNNLVEWEALRPYTNYSFLAKLDADGDADITTEYCIDFSGTDLENVANTWVDCTDYVKNDEPVPVTDGYDKLAVRFTWGAPGSIRSFGVMYANSRVEGFITNKRLREVFTNNTGVDLTTGDTVLIPNSGHYPVGDKNLRVSTLSGVRLFPGNNYHYTELNERTIMLQNFTLPPGESIVFECEYDGYMDSTLMNHQVLKIEHETDPNSVNYGKHKLEDVDNPGNEYILQVRSGSLEIVPI